MLLSPARAHADYKKLPRTSQHREGNATDLCRLCHEYNVLSFVSLTNSNIIFSFSSFSTFASLKNLTFLFKNHSRYMEAQLSIVGEIGSMWRTGPDLVYLMNLLHGISQCPFFCGKLCEFSFNERCYKKVLFPNDMLLPNETGQG